MATFQQYPQQHELPLFQNLHTFPLDQYGFPRSKTPTESLVNHTGYSPGPLITTPPISRNPSQPPEPSQDYTSEPLPWDNGSFSNSPTSVMTPDPESMEVEMIDSSQFFYPHHAQNMSTQATHGAVSAMDTNMFISGQDVISDQAVDAAFHDTLLSESERYQHQYGMQDQQLHPMALPQYQHYDTQPLQHDPWNGQGPARSTIVPRSGHVMFDPATEQLISSGYVTNVDTWRMNHPEPSYLISPSEPTMPPQDNFYFATAQHLAQSSQNQIPRTQMANQLPIEMHLTRASPPPDNQGFINYDASSPFFSDYHTSSNNLPSSLTRTAGSHVAPYEPVISPTVASPIGSEDMLSSYTQSESGVSADRYFSNQFMQGEVMPSQTLQADYLPDRSMPEATFDASPEPETAQSAAAKALAKSGGRALGTHLEPQVAKAAHDMRRIVACWHCVLQRDKCGPGEICERCLKRSQRPNADRGLGCCRIKLVDLSAYFLPALVTQMHEDSNLTHFVTQYIHQWGNVELEVYMTCGQDGMPRIPVKVYEFSPRGNALLVQIQYNTDPNTHQRVAVEKKSPALGMVHINYNEEKKYDKYITDIVDHHLDAFGELCWKEDDNDFQQKLFKLMTRVKAKNEDEARLLHEVFRLVVVTYIMSHTLTIAEETKVATLSRMRSYGGQNSYVENYTSPRMTNRQLKYFFSRLQRSIQTTVLNKLQQIFKSSKGCDKWLAAFVTVLGMCMALEDQQKTIHLVMETKARTEGIDHRDAQGQADIANREIDARIHFVQQIFRWKYNRKCNPIRDADHAWDKEVGFGDSSSVNFVRQVVQLVKDNTDYLQGRQQVSISPANQTKYTARLVGQFLLSFYMPNA
ncbi:hypothetical protein LEMA_P102400.1 [Plenodomus lingam JN3]|uniref:Uncharacterized protein n=1 Tax=Leptosphaeria maculans (strain JN3 / isolate v23.1.3 / race Av1-4-5-6-7-8) TaxID=985895 RepID=E4ZZJ3_LEPMJ|nr:hypothetical protein LEMA_P102400.1 [Plenodomus lingam JN3]CBX97109.1 hypothetical protein LEMA_P102400.1 [Plenodomus lingam JN3]